MTDRDGQTALKFVKSVAFNTFYQLIFAPKNICDLWAWLVLAWVEGLAQWAVVTGNHGS
jgi:hypothetical protein